LKKKTLQKRERGRNRRGDFLRKHSVCMTNALAGAGPSPHMPPSGGRFGGGCRRKQVVMAKKDLMVSVRLTSEERKRLDEICEISGLSVSTIFRKWLAEEKIQQKRPEEIHDLYVAINRIGNNINQIARKANAGFATKNDVIELKFLMSAIEEKIIQVANR